MLGAALVTGTAAQAAVGATPALDRTVAYMRGGATYVASGTTGVMTATYQGRSWITQLDLGTGTRTPVRRGSQATVKS